MSNFFKRLAGTVAVLATAVTLSLPASAALVTYTQSQTGFSYDADVVSAGFNAALGSGYTHLAFIGASNTNGAAYSPLVTFSSKVGTFGGSNSGSVNAAGEIGPASSWDGILNVSFNGGYVSSVGFGLVWFNAPSESIRLYDEANTLIASFNNQLGNDFSLWGVQATGGEHISRIELDGNFFAIQDVAFGKVGSHQVPEPASILLLGLSLLGLGVVRRNKN